MSSINKSFVWGIFAASLTWSISLYLYWSLMQKDDLQSNNITRNYLNNFIATNQEFNNIKHNSVLYDSKNEEHKYRDKSKNTFLDKLQRYKKQKKFEKISRKLINDLKPITFSEDEFGMVKNQEDQYIKDIGYKRHAFNVLISNKLGLLRTIPDTRHKLCSNQTYDSDLPTASIIMCFYNEHLMTLLRSMMSVIDKTPPNLLNEIILVDDFSDYDDLKSQLELEIYKLKDSKKIRLLRNDKREGLIRSRVFGARNATGDVLIFLDSHIEVNQDWVNPLLSRIKQNSSILAMPVIDIINSDTFAYTSSPLVRGGFNWGLHFKWDNLPEGSLNNDEDFVGPFKSPTMAGGLFAVNRNYFVELGEYDMGMDVWGGENLEISFRVWQCGGSIELIPCSRVGHVFRKVRPYGALGGSDTMVRNSLRVAHVWMDDYIDYFLAQQPSAKYIDYGNITDRQELRDKFKCKPFSWYLQNIYPELEIPGEAKKVKNSQPQFEPWHLRKRNYIRNFMIRLSNTSLCIATVGEKENGLWKRGGTLELANCLRIKSQMWYETDRAELVLGLLLCLETSGGSSITPPLLNKCHEMGGDQEWKHRKDKETPIYNMAAGTCLSVNKPKKGSILQLEICSNSSLNKWDLVIF